MARIDAARSNSFAGNNDRDRVLAATRLEALIGEHVALVPKGREFVGLCPFHDDRSPSLHVVVHKGDGFYKCFACGAAGNAIDFAMNFLGMDFPAALRHLAARAGIALSEAPPRSGEARDAVGRGALVEATAEAVRHWRRLLSAARAGRQASPAARRAAEILAERGISDEMIDRFELGVASDAWDDLVGVVRAARLDERAFAQAGLVKPRREGGGLYDAFRNRIIFPIHDEAQRPVAVGARRIDPQEEPKYLNSAESPIFSKSRVLYGLHLARAAIRDRNAAVVTEGYTDVIACHQAGLRHVVATLGTALTGDHARVLRRLCERVVLLFDGDEAGQKAADRAAEVFFEEPIDVLVCVLPDGRDPDELLREPGGRERFEERLAAAVPVIDFLVDRFAQRWREAATLSGRETLLRSFVGRLADLGLAGAGPLRMRHVLGTVAECVRLPMRTLESLLEESGRAAASAARRATRRIAEPSPEAATPDGAADEMPDRMPDGPPAPPAIRLAEEAVLALLVGHPQLAETAIDAGDGIRLPVTEAIGPSGFLHPPHRALAQRLFPLLEGGTAPTMGQLLAEVARPELRELASTLYLAAHRRTEGRIDAARPMLHQVCADLDAVRRRRGLADDASLDRGAADPSGAAELVERIRRRGHDPAAIARRSRR